MFALRPGGCSTTPVSCAGSATVVRFDGIEGSRKADPG
jgi:hypothetical protein